MLRSLTFFFISICIFIGNVDARSRNPRTTDFDEISRLVQADLDELRQELQSEGLDLNDIKGMRLNCSATSRLSVDHDAGVIKWYGCLYGLEVAHQAYLNELELSKATLGISGGHLVRIPCKANSQCLMGKQEDKSFFWFRLYSKNNHSIANQIIELLKPN